MRCLLALLLVLLYCLGCWGARRAEEQEVTLKKPGVDAQQRGTKLNLDFDGEYGRSGSSKTGSGDWGKGDKSASAKKGEAKAEGAKATRSGSNYEASRRKTASAQTSGKTEVSDAHTSGGKQINHAKVEKFQKDKTSTGLLGGLTGGLFGRGGKVEAQKAEVSTKRKGTHEAVFSKSEKLAQAGQYQATGVQRNSNKIIVNKGRKGIINDHTITKQRKGGQIVSNPAKFPKATQAEAYHEKKSSTAETTKVKYLKIPVYSGTVDKSKKAASVDSLKKNKPLAEFQFQGADEKPCPDVRGNKWTDRDFKVETKRMDVKFPSESGPSGKTYKWPSCGTIKIPMRLPAGTLVKDLAAVFTIHAPHGGKYVCDSKYSCGDIKCFYPDLCGSQLVSSDNNRERSATDYVFKKSENNACDQPVSTGRNILNLEVEYCPPAESEKMTKGAEKLLKDSSYRARTANIIFRVDIYEKKKSNDEIIRACKGNVDANKFKELVSPNGCREATVSYTGKTFFGRSKLLDDKAKGSGPITSSSSSTRTSSSRTRGGSSRTRTGSSRTRTGSSRTRTGSSRTRTGSSRSRTGSRFNPFSRRGGGN